MGKKKAATDKATSWQKFNKKASARSKTGFLTGKIQAIWPSDGLWYEATLTEQTEKGWLVTWKEEGSASEVAFDRVRITQGTQKKRQVKEILTPGGYKIPESLQIIPTDTEEVKAAKRRK